MPVVLGAVLWLVRGFERGLEIWKGSILHSPELRGCGGLLMMLWSVHTVGECGALVCIMMRYNGFLRLIALEGRGDITEDINKPIRCSYVVQGYMMGLCGTKL